MSARRTPTGATDGALWLVVPARFCGPPRSGNGGWTAGALAAHLPGPGATEGRAVTVTLRSPPPLDDAMAIARDGATTRLWHGETEVAEAVVADHGPAPVAPVDADEARSGETRFPGRTEHPFATCFGCGTDRGEGDGLRIFPGPVAPVDGHRRVAATWTPHPSQAGPPPDDGASEGAGGGPGGGPGDDPGAVSLAIAWAALDCVGGWSAEHMGDRPMVLGRMTCAVDALPRIGEEHVVVGLDHGTEGRRTETSATLYDARGRVVARARHTWIAIDPARFG